MRALCDKIDKAMIFCRQWIDDPNVGRFAQEILRILKFSELEGQKQFAELFFAYDPDAKKDDEVLTVNLYSFPEVPDNPDWSHWPAAAAAAILIRKFDGEIEEIKKEYEQ